MEVDPAVLPDDGVGPEVTTEAFNVLQAVAEKFGHKFNFNEGLVDGVAIDTLTEGLSYESLCIIVEYAKAESKRPIMSNMPGPNWRGK